MSQVENKCLHNVVQPFLFFTAAFLAGRSIQSFPGATPKGLLLSAAIGSGAILASQTCALKNESAWYSLARVVASLALAALFAPYAARALNGRADITMPAALRFGLIEAVLAMGLAIVSSYIASAPKDLEDLYNEYQQDAIAWKTRLSQQERMTLVQRFYQGDFPPLSLQDVRIAEDVFDDIPPTDFNDMSENQLKWHVQMLKHVKDFTNENLFVLNLALHRKNLPMEWKQGISQEGVIYAQNNPQYIELLYAYFFAHPFEFHRACGNNIDFGEMFKMKEPIPELGICFQGLEIDSIERLSQECLQFIMNQPQFFALSVPQRSLIIHKVDFGFLNRFIINAQGNTSIQLTGMQQTLDEVRQALNAAPQS